MVIMVLLKLAFTCATPEAMFLRSRLRTRVASLPIFDPFAARLRRARPRHFSFPFVSSSLSEHDLFKKAGPHFSGLCSSRRLFLAGNRFRRPLAGPGVGVRSLPAHRQPAPMA